MERQQKQAEDHKPAGSRAGLSRPAALVLAAAILLVVAACLRAASPHIRSMLKEVYSSLEDDDAEGTGNASLWHRQRAMALRVNPSSTEMTIQALERAQQAAELEELDAEFLGDALVSAADYEEEEDRGQQLSQSGQRSIFQVPRRPGGALTSQRPKFPDRRGQSGIGQKSHHSGYMLRRRRHWSREEEPQQNGQLLLSNPGKRGRQAWARPPVALADPIGGIADTVRSISRTATSPANVTATGPATTMMRGGYAIDFVEQNGNYYGYRNDDGPIKVWESPQWKLRKNPTWQQPQSVCPGSPEKLNLKDGPPKKGLKRVKEGIRNMADGFYREDMENGTVRLVQNRCMFFTKDCADLNLSYGGPQAKKKLKLSDEAFEFLRQNKLMDLKPRMLGSCAVVANGENLLRGGRGADIDAHDTIFRHNTPVKGYGRAVGKRPSSVMWVKSKYEKNKQNKNSGTAELMYDLLLGVDNVPKSFQHKGKGLLIVNKMGGYNRMARERFLWYKLAGAGSKNHPSGGFSRPLTLLSSGLCTRVDLYGFSSRPSGKYFQKDFTVLATHMMKFEHWVYRYLQSIGKLCVYGS